MIVQNNFATKILQTTFAKVFFVFALCFVKRKLVKIFYVHIM